MSRYLTRLFISMILPAVSLMASASNPGGKWQLHPSFYQSVEKIQPTDNSVYFFVQQELYDTGYTDYSKNSGSLFRYSKSAAESGIEALSNLYPGFPAGIRAFDYSPANKVGIAVADDSGVWLLPDAEEPVCLGYLLSQTLPGKPHANSITESPDDNSLWIAASYGYAQVSAAEQKIVNAVKTDYPIERITKMNGSLVILSGGKVYIAPAAENASTLSSLTMLPIDGQPAASISDGNGNLSGILSIVPLTSNTFALVGPSASADTFTLAAAVRKNNAWKIYSIGEAPLRTIPENQAITSIMANNALASKDGYYYQTNTDSYLLKKGIDPADSDTNESYKNKILVSQKKTDEASMESASWDFSEFWFFSPKKGFYSRKADASPWQSPAAAIWPSAPVSYISTTMKYHPTAGLLVANHSNDWQFNQNVPYIPWLISGFKNGQWTNFSPVFYNHPELENDENFKKIYNNYIERFPMSKPDGIAFSQSDPSMVYAGSLTDGWVRLNVDNPASLPLRVGNGKSYFVNTPGFINDNPTFTAWSSLCDYSAPDFDSDGRMWMLFLDIDKAQTSNPTVNLKWYSADELASMKDVVANPSLFKSPHTIEFETAYVPTNIQELVALKNPNNKNIIAFHLGVWNSPLYLYDHNGTPEDTSDDRIAILENLHDAIDGTTISINKPVAIWEDPQTGYVWLSSMLGTFMADPSKAFSDPDNAVYLQRVKSAPDVADADKILFQSVIVTGGTTDDAGNLWVSTNGAGIWCLSPDRTEIVGHYTEANSGMPSNKTYSIAYNPERVSVMVSTDAGYAEFFPEVIGSKNASINVSPSTISPDFKGLVTFSGLSADKAYVLTDAEGSIKVTLGKVTDGSLQWDGTDASGNRLPTGKYLLEENNVATPLAEIIVLN